MRYANLLTFIVLVWTRGFHYMWICYNLFARFYNDKAWGCFYASIFLCTAFFGFNIGSVIMPFYHRTKKWFKRKLPEKGETKK